MQLFTLPTRVKKLTQLFREALFWLVVPEFEQSKSARGQQ
jgi:hypothetical protein